MVGRPSTREPSAFGKRLSALREERGLSQAELAGRLGVSQQLIAYYERRAPSPTLEFVEKAAAGLGVDVDVLVSDGKKQKRSKPGPISQLEERIERVRLLPKKKQELAIKMLDLVLDGA
jgi:transcriptional regulator with XRE-family HTH domain